MRGDTSDHICLIEYSLLFLLLPKYIPNMIFGDKSFHPIQTKKYNISRN